MSKTQTIQATSKKWKLFQLIGFLGITIGIVSIIAGMNSESASGSGFGVTAAVVGIVSYIVGRVGAWWHHH